MKTYTAESLLAQVTDANGGTQTLTYDAAGNVIAQTDALGNVTHYAYDRVNRLSSVTDALGNKTQYTYDAGDNLAKVTDALKQVTQYTYDKHGSLTSETDALGNKVEYAYTPEGWLESQTKADGTQIRYTYDKTGNLLTQDVGEGQTIRSEYNDIGQMTVVSSPEGDIRYQYDERGFLISVENARGDVVHYAYDERGNKTEMTYPDGQTVSYTYDEMNRMVSATSPDGEVTTYTYDAAGRRVQSASEQLITVYEYDVLGNLTKQETTGQTAISFVYGYDARNSITGEVRTENGETTQSDYAYDPLGQLTSFTQSTGYAESYAYDKAGNMTQKVITPTGGAQDAADAITLTMKYNKGNQLTQMSHGKDSLTYAYDKNGNMTQKALRSKAYGKLTDSYAYNAQDMLTGYSGYDGFTQVFTYDASGMRLTKKEAGNENRSTLEELLRGEVAGLPEVVMPEAQAESVNPGELLEGYEWATTEYLYDITAEYYQVIGETVKDKNGSTTTAYAYGIERIAAYGAEETTRYVYDGRGSVAKTVTTAPEAPKPQVQSYAYTPFGEQMGGTKVSGFGYNAEAYDAKTGMVNLRARQYEPAMNRFSQKDILRGDKWNPLSLNRYAYTLNNPISYADPSGEFVAIVGAPALYAAGGTIVVTGATIVKGAAVVLGGIALWAYNQITAKSRVKIQPRTIDIRELYGFECEVTDVAASQPQISTSEKLTDIAKGFGNYKCVEAAKAMETHLKKKGEGYKIVTIKYVGGRGYIVSISKGDRVISTNGFHMGVKYQGRVYCNVHPYGMAESAWRADFVGTGVPIYS